MCIVNLYRNVQNPLEYSDDILIDDISSEKVFSIMDVGDECRYSQHLPKVKLCLGVLGPGESMWHV